MEVGQGPNLGCSAKGREKNKVDIGLLSNVTSEWSFNCTYE
jgi:hypothetical protein